MLYRNSGTSGKLSGKLPKASKSGKRTVDERLHLKLIPKQFEWELLSLIFHVLKDQGGIPKDLVPVISGFIRNRDILSLDGLSLMVAQREGITCCEASGVRLITRFLTKIEGDLPYYSKADPMMKFQSNENMNSQTNKKFLLRQDSEIPYFEKNLKRVIAQMLGRCPRILSGKHGPGASLTIPRRKATELNKWCLPWNVSERAKPYLIELVENNDQLKRYLEFRYGHENPYFSLIGMHHVEDLIDIGTTLTNHNRLAFVPKNFKSFRTIAIEPTFNVFFQLYLHDLLSSRLNKYGVYIENQEKNQEAAKNALKLRHATIDLSSASDTISYEVVKALLPRDWFKLLDDLRAQYYKLPDGSLRRYEMFSSMGNGITFALMSLLFKGICYVAMTLIGRGHMHLLETRVYGDDLIVPVDSVKELCSLLSYYGFKINFEKSFDSGPFRESCGKDYYLGFDISPVYLREIPSNPVHIIKTYNALFCWFQKNCMLGFDIVSNYLTKYLNFLPFGPTGEIFDSYLFTEDYNCRYDHKSMRPYILAYANSSVHKDTTFFFQKKNRVNKVLPFHVYPWLMVCVLDKSGTKAYPNFLQKRKKRNSVPALCPPYNKTVIRRIYITAHGPRCGL